jgi:Restriction endonuclease
MQKLARKQAKEQGLTQYFTGKPCKHGHITFRQVSDRTCIECKKVTRQSDSMKLWNLSYQRRRRVEDETYRLKERAKSRRWRSNHPEQMANILKDYAKRPTSILSKKSRDHIRRAYKKGANVDKVEFQKVWDSSSGICYLCGDLITKGTEQYDHVIPLSKRGAHTYDNLRAVHNYCNKRKYNKTPIEFWHMLVNLGEANNFQQDVLNN